MEKYIVTEKHEMEVDFDSIQFWKKHLIVPVCNQIGESEDSKELLDWEEIVKKLMYILLNEIGNDADIVVRLENLEFVVATYLEGIASGYRKKLNIFFPKELSILLQQFRLEHSVSEKRNNE